MLKQVNVTSIILYVCTFVIMKLISKYMLSKLKNDVINFFKAWIIRNVFRLKLNFASNM